MASRGTGTARPAYGGAVAAAGVGVLVLGLWFGGGRPQPSIPGLPSPGPVTLWGLPVVRLALDVCAAMTVGLLVTAVVLALGHDERERARIARGARWWAAAWAACAAATFALTLSDVLGLPVHEALASEILVAFALQLPQGRALLLVAGLAAAVAAACAVLPRSGTARVAALGVAVAALLPPAYVGHSATAADHNLAVSSLMLHVVAVAVWAGGLAGLLLCLRGSPGLAGAVRRFSALALGCFVAAAVSGLCNAWIRLGAPSLLWESRYGLLVLAKLAALAVLGWFGARHRRRTIALLAAAPEPVTGPGAGRAPAAAGPGTAARAAPGADAAPARRRPFLRLAAGEVAVMAAVFGLAVALSRTPPPPAEQAYGEEGLLGYALRPFTPGNLLAEARPDPLVLLPLAAAAAGYLAGVRRLARAGRPWPAGRTAAWLAGLALLGYALAGGVGAYAPAMFSVAAVQYALAGVAAPALLAFGAPLTLALAATAAPDAPFHRLPRAVEAAPALRVLAHPAAALAVHAVPYLVLFPLGGFGAVQPDHARRLLTLAVLAVTGTVFCAVVTGVDPLPRPVPLHTRLRLLGVAIAVHAGCALQVLAGPVVAASWYGNLALPWAPDRDLDQRLGALLGLGVATAALAALVVTLLLWRRAAQRRLRRGRARAAVPG